MSNYTPLHSFFKHCCLNGEADLFLTFFPLFASESETFTKFWVNEYKIKKIPRKQTVKFLSAVTDIDGVSFTYEEAMEILKVLKIRHPATANKFKLRFIKTNSQRNIKELKHSPSGFFSKSERRRSTLTMGMRSSRRRKMSLANLTLGARIRQADKAEDIAKALMVQEAIMFSKLDINQVALDKKPDNTIVWFNQIAHWVAYTILTKSTYKARQVEIKKWIKVATIFNNKYNFSGLMAVLAGLNNISVQRLACWKNLSGNPKNQFDFMDELMNCLGNYRNYRKKLTSIESIDETKVIIPYLGVPFRDIVMIYEGNKLYTPDKSDVNLETIQMIYDIVSRLKRYQQLIRNSGLMTAKTVPVNIPPVINKNELDELSRKIKPFNTTIQTFRTPTVSSNDDAEESSNGLDVSEPILVEKSKPESITIGPDPNKWNTCEVLVWLDFIGLPEHKQTFKKNAITGIDLFELDRDDLESMGINKVGHRLKILSRIKEL